MHAALGEVANLAVYLAVDAYHCMLHARKFV